MKKRKEIVAVKTSKSNVSDCKMLKELLDSFSCTPKKISVDGAYDGLPTRHTLHERGIEELIPPPENAQFRPEPEMLNRNNFLKIWKGFGGDSVAKKLTKKLLGYCRRSLVETAFSRMKRIFGDRFCSRLFQNISKEAHLKCWILNQMTI